MQFEAQNASPYTANWRAFVRAGVKASARAMVPVFYDHLKPASIVDVGCGEGHWLNEFAKCGATELLGIDTIKPYALDDLFDYSVYDLNEPLPVQPRFDLCLCLEVAEHLRPESADTLIDSLCALSDRILFSAAIPGQGGAGHVNEQWASYWVEKFKARGYDASDYFRWKFWNNEKIESWYSQNILLFARDGIHDMTLPPDFDFYFGFVRDVIHPRLWAEKVGV